GGDTLTVLSNDLGNTGAGGALTDSDPIAITVNNVDNDPPVNIMPGNPSTDEDVATVITGIAITDPDAGSADVEVTFSVTSGTLLVSPSVSGGVVAGDVADNGTNSVTVTASLAKINATLGETGLTYTPTADFYGTVTFTVHTNDLGHSDAGGPKSDNDQRSIFI